MTGAPPVVRWLLVVTAAIWVMLELRQSITHRPEGVKASWGGEVLFRVIVGIAALAAGVLILRYREPDRPRAFRAPGGPIAPIITIVTCLLLMAGLPIMNWIRFFVWLAIGLVIYYNYGRRRSTLRAAHSA